MRKRKAPIRQTKEQVQQKYRKYHDPDYDSLRPDKKKLDIQISAQEEKECSKIIVNQMKKRFGPDGGIFKLKRIIIG